MKRMKVEGMNESPSFYFKRFLSLSPFCLIKLFLICMCIYITQLFASNHWEALRPPPSLFFSLTFIVA